MYCHLLDARTNEWSASDCDDVLRTFNVKFSNPGFSGFISCDVTVLKHLATWRLDGFDHLSSERAGWQFRIMTDYMTNQRHFRLPHFVYDFPTSRSESAVPMTTLREYPDRDICPLSLETPPHPALVCHDAPYSKLPTLRNTHAFPNPHLFLPNPPRPLLSPFLTSTLQHLDPYPRSLG